MKPLLLALLLAGCCSQSDVARLTTERDSLAVALRDAWATNDALARRLNISDSLLTRMNAGAKRQARVTAYLRGAK
jgi:hypothetical protein